MRLVVQVLFPLLEVQEARPVALEILGRGQAPQLGAVLSKKGDVLLQLPLAFPDSPHHIGRCKQAYVEEVHL